MPLITPIPHTERLMMRKIIQKTRDKNHARRLIAMLILYRTESVRLPEHSAVLAPQSGAGLTGLRYQVLKV